MQCSRMNQRTKVYKRKSSNNSIEIRNSKMPYKRYNTRNSNVVTQPSCRISSNLIHLNSSHRHMSNTEISKTNSSDSSPTMNAFQENSDNISTNVSPTPFDYPIPAKKNNTNILLNAFRNDFSSQIPESQKFPLSFCNTSQCVIATKMMSDDDDDDSSLTTVNDESFEVDNFLNQAIPLHEEIAAAAADNQFNPSFESYQSDDDEMNFASRMENIYSSDEEEVENYRKILFAPKCMKSSSLNPNLNNESVRLRPEYFSLKQRTAFKPNYQNLNCVLADLEEEYIKMRKSIHKITVALKCLKNPASAPEIQNCVRGFIGDLVNKGREIDHFNKIYYDLATEENLRKPVKFVYNPEGDEK